MIKKEFKFNLKSFIIWLSILIIMFLLVYLIYPYIITDDTMKGMDELMKVFPEELLKAFNMDVSSIATAYGWFKSEGFMFILIIIGLYSSILGGSILLKEENDKTIEYLASLPITRNRIVTNKIIVGMTNIVMITLILGIFNYISFLILGDFKTSEFLLLSISPILVGLPLFSISIFISTFMHKTKKVVGLSLGIVFISYMFNILSEISSNVEALKYFSIYTLADTRGIMANNTISLGYILVSFLITFVFIFLTYIKYNKKELV